MDTISISIPSYPAFGRLCLPSAPHAPKGARGLRIGGGLEGGQDIAKFTTFIVSTHFHHL